MVTAWISGVFGFDWLFVFGVWMGAGLGFCVVDLMFGLVWMWHGWC